MRITLRSDAALSNANLGANVEAESRNGTVFAASVQSRPEACSTPLIGKFVSLSERVLGRTRAEQASDMADLGAVLDAVTPAKQG